MKVYRSIDLKLSDLDESLCEVNEHGDFKYDIPLHFSFEITKNEHDEIYLNVDSLHLSTVLGEFKIQSLSSVNLKELIKRADELIDNKIADIDFEFLTNFGEKR